MTHHTPTDTLHDTGDPLAVSAIIGRASDHLEHAEARLQQAKAAHTPRKALAARVRRLKARCAALGAGG